MSRLFIVLAASASLFVVPDVQSAEACGVKVSLKGAKMRQARASLASRRAKGSAGERTPTRVGPIQVSARGAISGGGGASGAGTGTVEKRIETPAEKSKPVAKRRKQRPKPVEKTPEPVVAENTPTPTPEPTPTPDPAGEPTPAAEPVDVAPTDKGKFHKEYSFENGSSNLGDQEREHLAATVVWLQANPKKKITVQGHASRVGSADTNQAISDARAQAVIDFFVSEGISADRFTKRAMGWSKPAYTPGSNPKNRRVVLIAK